MDKTKPFYISKKSVMAAWEKVKANKGCHGIDKVSIEAFEANLKDNLYKLWNRMSSGSYFPHPVRAVEIPKSDHSKRILGIPTVADRVAQMVVKDHLEPMVEPCFHEDSYGYRPKKSALEAVGIARKRCWQKSWCIDLDIKDFFNTLDHELVMKAIRFHTDEKWIHLYVERWLKSPLHCKGELTDRESGTPQGGVISPLLANIFMHYAFDAWMKRHFPEVMFERFADDMLVHCSTYQQAKKVLEAIRDRLKECGLELHPDKTKIVYCKNGNNKGSHENENFDFLGYTFRPRLARDKGGKRFVGFLPAVSKRAMKRICEKIRRWRIHRQNTKNITDLAKGFNTIVQGWVNYYGCYYKTAMCPIFKQIDIYLIRWVMSKYKRFRGHKTRAAGWLKQIKKREPGLFVHWKVTHRSFG